MPANPFNIRFISLPFSIAAILLLTACMESGQGPGDRSSKKKIEALTRLTSANLKAAPKGSAAPNPSAASPDVERCDMGYPCMAPDGFQGRVYSGNFMVGGNGGAPGVPLRVIEGYDTSYHGEHTGRGGNAIFDLGKATELGGAYQCCDEGRYPTDDLAIVRRLEFAFDYLDATFTIPSATASPLAGKTFTIRTVYVDSGSASDLPAGDTLLVQGDKLLRRQGESGFTWCTDAECGKASRPAKPLQASWISDVAFLGGYEHYAQVALILKQPMTFTRDEALTGKWLFTADFDLSRAVVFRVGDLALLQTEADMVNAFDMYAKDGGPGAIGVGVNLTKTRLDSVLIR
jgi:hypothetical protein